MYLLFLVIVFFPKIPVTLFTLFTIMSPVPGTN